MLMNISLKKRTLLVLLSGLTATFTLAQQQPLPEWQSQYAVGLNKLAPHTYVWPYANASDIEKPGGYEQSDRKSTRLNSSHPSRSRMPSSA